MKPARSFALFAILAALGACSSTQTETTQPDAMGSYVAMSPPGELRIIPGAETVAVPYLTWTPIVAADLAADCAAFVVTVANAGTADYAHNYQLTRRGVVLWRNDGYSKIPAQTLAVVAQSGLEVGAGPVTLEVITTAGNWYLYHAAELGDC